MATMFEQIFGNAKSPGGLLGNPAFMVGSGLLSNQGNPWGGAIQGLAVDCRVAGIPYALCRLLPTPKDGHRLATP